MMEPNFRVWNGTVYYAGRRENRKERWARLGYWPFPHRLTLHLSRPFVRKPAVTMPRWIDFMGIWGFNNLVLYALFWWVTTPWLMLPPAVIYVVLYRWHLPKASAEAFRKKIYGAKS